MSIQKKTTHIPVAAYMAAIAAIMMLWACSTRQTRKIESADDLSGCNIGVQLGTTGDTQVSATERQKKNNVERYTKAADAIQALVQGKIDCVVVDEQPAMAFCRQNNSLSILPTPLCTEQLAMCLAKTDTAMARKVGKAISDLKRDGTASRIINAHIREGKTHAYTPRHANDNAPTLTVATNATFKPYEYYDNGKIVGLDIDMAMAIADRLGMRIKIEDMEFDAIIAAVQSGKARLGAACMTVTDERRKSILFTDTYAPSRQVVVVRDDKRQAAASHSLAERFTANFIVDNRYVYLLEGLGNTVIITVCAMLISLILGTVIAIVRTTHDSNGGLTVANALCRFYLMVIRGTPTMVQLLIIYYVVFAAVDVSKVLVAVVAFGLNSAAYLAEVIRSGIMSVEKGQMEAGRSLGLSYAATMRRIVMPQAFKNVLPAIGNEMITLLKETSISGYIGLADLTKGSDIIRSITYDAIMPLGLVAAIYFMLVAALATGVNKIEKKLQKNEKR